MSLSGATIPLPGPTLRFREWSRSVHERVQSFLPDVTATGSSKGATWQRGSLVVRIVPDGQVWWTHFDRAGTFAMPPLCVERHDAFTAAVVADTMLGFFDSALSTPSKGRAEPAAQS